MSLINLSETLNMYNYLFKNIFKVLAKFIRTYISYTTTYFFLFTSVDLGVIISPGT